MSKVSRHDFRIIKLSVILLIICLLVVWVLAGRDSTNSVQVSEQPKNNTNNSTSENTGIFTSSPTTPESMLNQLPQNFLLVILQQPLHTFLEQRNTTIL